MKRKIKIIAILFMFSCGISRKIENYECTNKIKEGIYEEIFIGKGGVWAGNSYEAYLTDSTNFRISLGIYDDDEHFEFEVEGNKIKIYTIIWKTDKNESYKFKIDSCTYEIDKLKVRKDKI